jgi:plasmid stabilization system protein ParE
MTNLAAIKLTANFESNLENIERYLSEAEISSAFDALLDELLNTVIPNLERFPEMGRQFLSRKPHSVETTAALKGLRAKLLKLSPNQNALREIVFKDFLMLYAFVEGTVHLLAIRHQRQLSFDLTAHWG